MYTYFKGKWLKPLAIFQKLIRRHIETSSLPKSFRRGGDIETWNSYHIVCTNSSVLATPCSCCYSRPIRSGSEHSLLAGEALWTMIG